MIKGVCTSHRLKLEHRRRVQARGASCGSDAIRVLESFLPLHKGVVKIRNSRKTAAVPHCQEFTRYRQWRASCILGNPILDNKRRKSCEEQIERTAGAKRPTNAVIDAPFGRLDGKANWFSALLGGRPERGSGRKYEQTLIGNLKQQVRRGYEQASGENAECIPAIFRLVAGGRRLVPSSDPRHKARTIDGTIITTNRRTAAV